MRVAIVSPYPTFPYHDQLGCWSESGENHATWTVALADALAQIPDTEVHVVTEAWNIPRSATIHFHQLHLHFVQVPARFKTLTLWQWDRHVLNRTLRDIQPDLVHGQGLENQFGYIAAQAPFPRLLTIHGITSLSNEARRLSAWHRNRLVQPFSRYCLAHTKHLVIVNPFIQSALQLDNIRHRLYPIPNAVAPLYFEPSQELRAPDQILSIGYVEPLKGHETTLRALALLKRHGYPLRLSIAGPIANQSYADHLTAYANQEGLELELLGFQTPTQIRQHFARATLLVHASRLETFGMAVAEAMVTSTPVVATTAGGLPNLIRHNETGLLFQPGNATELADHVERLLNAPAFRAQLATAAANHARLHYHPTTIAQQTRVTYEAVLHDHVRN